MEKVLIIEDEELAAQKLVMLLMKINPELNIISILSSVRDSVDWLKINTADLIFLDINLSDDLSFKIFEKVQIETPIIFTTAYDEYAIKAFKQNSLDYLLKPIAIDELRASLEKYERYKNRNNTMSNKLQSLVANYVEHLEYKKRILVNYGGRSKSISVDDVAYIYAYEKGVYLTSFDGTNYLTDETLDTLEQQLDGSKFHRINRKYLVNAQSITDIEKYSTRRLKVNVIPVPRMDIVVPAERISDFKKWLNS